MRFFSNDKDARDDQQGVDVRERADEVNPDQAHDDHPERVQSDPVSVPPQRAGSPWSSTPDTAGSPESADSADRELADNERRDGTVDTGTDGHDGDPAFHDPALHDPAFHRPDDALRPDDSEVRHDGDALVPEPEPAKDGTAAYRSDQDQPVDLALDDDDRETGAHAAHGDPEPGETVREDTTPPDHAVADTAPDATVDGDSYSDSDSDQPDGKPGTADGTALKDEGGFDDPKAVDPATEQPLDSGDTGAGESNADAPGETTAPVAAAVAAGAGVAAAGAAVTGGSDSKPGSVAGPDLGTLFGKDDAQELHERWRDVQLRFVDSPKEATEEAAHLVDEAVEKLTAALRSQKDALSGDHGEDTEKLRVELRGYRDILNRILGL